MTDHRFSKQQRLLRARDFEHVFERKCSTADQLIVVYAAPNQHDQARIGLTVSRKVGPAVVRNRWKRTLREAFRLIQHELPPLDIICIPRPRAVPNVRQLSQSLLALTRRLTRRLGSPSSTDTATPGSESGPEPR